MEAKIVSAIVISIIVGSAIGIGASYLIFNPEIQSLQTTSQSLQAKTQSLESGLSSQNITQGVVINNLTSLQGELQSDLNSMNSNVNSIQSNMTVTQSGLSSLNSSFCSLNSSFWILNSSYTTFSDMQGHQVTEVNTTSDSQSATFQIKGNMMEIWWGMIGNDPSSYVIVTIYAANGTEINAVGSSGTYGTFSSAIAVTPGDYYIKVTTNNLYWLDVVVADYY